MWRAGRSAILRSMPVLRLCTEFRRLSLLICAITAATSLIGAQTPAVTLTPAVVEAGSPELIRVTAPADAAVEGDWLGRKILFFAGATDRRGMRSREWTLKGPLALLLFG